jgi:hypothetical protein
MSQSSATSLRVFATDEILGGRAENRTAVPGGLKGANWLNTNQT